MEGIGRVESGTETENRVGNSDRESSLERRPGIASGTAVESRVWNRDREQCLKQSVKQLTAKTERFLHTSA